jgi:hypothetical protein
VVLCNANPTIRKILSAASPNETAAPIAKPSPNYQVDSYLYH